MSVHFNSKGLAFYYIEGNKRILLDADKIGVNPKMKRPMEAMCKKLDGWGYTAIETLGITNNRVIAGTNTTSKHANGTKRSGYRCWPDGTNGSKAIDIVTFIHREAVNTKTIHNPEHRAWMIAFMKGCGFSEFSHIKVGSTDPDHVHGGVK